MRPTRLALTLLGVLAILAVPAVLSASPTPAPSSQKPDPMRPLNLTHDLLVAGCGALDTMEATSRYGDTEEMALRLAFFNFCSGARHLFDQAHDGATPDSIRTTVTYLIYDARVTDQVIRRARIYRDVEDAWQSARTVLASVQQNWQVPDPPALTGAWEPVGSSPKGPSGPTASGPTGPSGSTGPVTSGASGPTGGETSGDWYQGITVQIESAEFKGTLNPSLEVRGTFQGRNLSHADLVILAGGKETYREMNAFDEIPDYFATHDRKMDASIPFTRSIPPDLLVSGENRVMIILYDKLGKKNYDAVNRTKKTLNW